MKVPGAVKMMYKNTGQQQATHLVVQSLSACVTDTDYSKVTDSAAEAGSRAVCDTVDRTTASDEAADAAAEAGSGPTSDVQQNQRQVCMCIRVCLETEAVDSDDDYSSYKLFAHTFLCHQAVCNLVPCKGQ